MLSPLPSRVALSAEVEDATYAIVMESMTAFGLEQAVRAALNGKHGSKFFPSPPELRELYDNAMEHHVRMRNRIADRERAEAQRIPPRQEPTPEAKARVKKLVERFHASLPSKEDKPEFDWSRVNGRFDRREAAE